MNLAPRQLIQRLFAPHRQSQVLARQVDITLADGDASMSHRLQSTAETGGVQ